MEKIDDGGIRERRIRRRELDLEGGIDSGKGKGRGNHGEEGQHKFWRGGRLQKLFFFLCGFLLVDCCCWDFGLGGQEI
jgi:hypothetical protein